MEPGKEKWVNDVMNSLEGVQKARAGTNLYAQVMSRLDEVNRGKVYEMVSTRTALRVAAGLLLIAGLNVFTFTMLTKKGSPDSQQVELKAFAKEYALTGNDYNF
jgi:hypothetical protein